jgi:hypothetical protein
MKVRDFMAVLRQVDPDAEVLVENADRKSYADLNSDMIELGPLEDFDHKALIIHLYQRKSF